MRNSAPSLFVFRVPAADASASSTYACLAWSLEEARARASAMGHYRAELIDQLGVPSSDPVELDDVVRRSPGLGAEWISLVDVLDVVMSRLTFGPFWALHVYGAAYGYDPNETPGVQAMQRPDGSLDVEITGLHDPQVENSAVDLRDWTIVPGSDGPFIPRMSRHYDAGWDQRRVAVDALLALTNAYGITNGDYLMFGESIADQVDSLGLLERVGEGPLFCIPRSLIEAARREQHAEAPRPSRRLPGEEVIGRFIELSSRLGPWDEGELTRRGTQWRNRWVVDVEALERAEVAVGMLGGAGDLEAVMDIMLQHANGDHSGMMLRSASTALLARDALAPQDYRSLTTAFATTLGKVHPEDPDRIDEYWGPSGREIRAFYDQVQNLTPRQEILLPLYREVTEREWDDLRAKAKGRLLAERRKLPWPLTLDAYNEGHEDDPLADTLLGIAANDLAGSGEGLEPEDTANLTVVCADVLGWIGTVQVRDPGGELGPQEEMLERLLDRVGALTDLEVERVALHDDDDERAEARVAAWTAAQIEFREGPWIRGDELPHQAAADAADALMVRDYAVAPPEDDPFIFTMEQYDLLTGPWRRAIGPIHPDDADLRTTAPDDGHDAEPRPDSTRADDRVFPWLRSALRRGDRDTGEGRLSLSASQIADVVMERIDTWPLGDVFAVLPESEWPTSSALPVRLGNRLAGGGELRGMSARDLLLMRNVGATSVERLIRDLVERTRASAQDGTTDGVRVAEVESDGHALSPAPHEPLLNEAIGLDLLRLADWARLTGATDRPLLAASGLTEPVEVTDARARLLAITARAVNPPSAEQPLAEVLGAHVRSLDDRVITILAARLFSRTPATLDELGARFGVTRERIRQLEAAGRTSLWQAVSEDERLADVVRAIVSDLPPISSLAGLLESIPALADQVTGIDQPAWFVLDRLDDSWEADDGWIGTPSLQAGRVATQELLSAVADPHGVVDLEELVSSPGALEDLDPVELQSWLEACGYAVHGKHLLLRSRGLLDWSEALLAIAGEPMTAEALLKSMPLERSVRSLRNALADSDLFVAIDRERWALAEWGIPEYGSLRHQIGLAVDDSDGGVPLDELVTTLSARFGLAPGSVVAYATSGEFSVTDGRVRRVEFRIARPRKTASQTRRLYRAPTGWSYRIQITTDHLRGSGFPIPIALFTELRTGEADRRIEFTSQDGIVPIIWNGTQPSCGSVRRFLLPLDAAVGDEAILHFDDSGEFWLDLADIESEDSLTTACRLVGIRERLDLKESRGSIGLAIGRPRADWPEIVRWLEERDDVDVADVLRAALLDHGMTASPGSASGNESSLS